VAVCTVAVDDVEHVVGELVVGDQDGFHVGLELQHAVQTGLAADIPRHRAQQLEGVPLALADPAHLPVLALQRRPLHGQLQQLVLTHVHVDPVTAARVA